MKSSPVCGAVVVRVRMIRSINNKSNGRTKRCTQVAGRPRIFIIVFWRRLRDRHRSVVGEDRYALDSSIMPSENDLIRILSLESRSLYSESSHPDILDAISLFAAVAIHLKLISREEALKTLKGLQINGLQGCIYPGAKCPSFAGPERIARASGEGRSITLEDMWCALNTYDAQQFAELCELFGVNRTKR